MENQTVLNFLDTEKDLMLKKDIKLISTLHRQGYLLKVEMSMGISECERYRQAIFKFSKGDTYGMIVFRLKMG